MADLRTLLLRMHRGHEPSAERLWALLAPRLRAYARAVLPGDQRDSGEDVVQGVFLTVLGRSRRELRGVEDVTAWMFRLTRNAALNHARGERRERDRMSRTPAERDERPGVRDIPDVVRAAWGLSDAQRDVVLLRHVGGLTLEQVGVALGVNRSTVASRERAGLAAMRAVLGGEWGHEMEASHAGA
ncbi:MAG: RNA polymerase sigma factor [Phycisphaerales bacterium JB040]